MIDEQIKELNDQLEFQHRNLNALLAISDASEEPLTMEMVFDRALQTVQKITGFSLVVLRLYNTRRRCFEVKAQHGMSEDMLIHMKCAPMEGSLNGEAARQRWPVVVPDLSTNRFKWDGPTPVEAGHRCVVSIPLLTENLVVGTMELASYNEYHWTESELAWLALVGRTIGNTIYQVRLNEKMRDYAALEERYRLSQEIHDGLAQLIGAMRLWAEDAQISMKAENLEEVKSSIDKIERTAREAYGSIREEIMGLRDTVLPGKDFVSVVADFLKRYQRQWGIDARLIYDHGNGYNDGLPITAMAEIQLLRIVQEGVTNVRRHAEASCIIVSIEEVEKNLVVSIQDNGKGFNPEQVKDENLGLRIMGERAASVDGEINIHSEKGLGTKIEIIIPLKDK